MNCGMCGLISLPSSSRSAGTVPAFRASSSSRARRCSSRLLNAAALMADHGGGLNTGRHKREGNVEAVVGADLVNGQPDRSIACSAPDCDFGISKKLPRPLTRTEILTRCRQRPLKPSFSLAKCVC
eukprot:490479-Pleurochrysis_carterae.AAC.3